MRIVLIGQAAFGADVFNKLKERGQDIVGVFCPPDPPKGKLDPLKEAAQAAGVPVFQPRRMKDPEVGRWYHCSSPPSTGFFVRPSPTASLRKTIHAWSVFLNPPIAT